MIVRRVRTLGRCEMIAGVVRIAFGRATDRVDWISGAPPFKARAR